MGERRKTRYTPPPTGHIFISFWTLIQRYEFFLNFWMEILSSVRDENIFGRGFSFLWYQFPLSCHKKCLLNRVYIHRSRRHMLACRFTQNLLPSLYQRRQTVSLFSAFSILHNFSVPYPPIIMHHNNRLRYQHWQCCPHQSGCHPRQPEQWFPDRYRHRPCCRRYTHHNTHTWQLRQ